MMMRAPSPAGGGHVLYAEITNALLYGDTDTPIIVTIDDPCEGEVFIVEMTVEEFLDLDPIPEG